MLGQIDPKKKSAVVVGGGVAGLLAAYQLAKRGHDVRLIEKSARLGGLIQTTSTPYGIAESAAHSFLATSPVTALCAEIGVELIAVNADSRARYIWRDKKMRQFPLHAREAMSLAWRASTAKRSETVDAPRSLADWARNHLGEAGLQWLLTPFVRGIYACAPDELAIDAAYPNLDVPPGARLISSLLRRNAKIAPRSRAQMMAPRLGMGAFVGQLEKALRHLPNVKVETQHALTPDEFSALHHHPDLNLVLCTEAPGAAELLKPLDAPTAALLLAIAYAPLVSVTVFVSLAAFKGGHAPQGVGVLCPDGPVLGVLFNSSAFSDRAALDHASFTVMLGGTRHPEILNYSDAQIRDLITQTLGEFFGPWLASASLEVAALLINRWPCAIPIYGPTLLKTWEAVNRGWCSQSGHVLFGNYSGKVSIRGMVESTPAFTANP